MTSGEQASERPEAWWADHVHPQVKVAGRGVESGGSAHLPEVYPRSWRWVSLQPWADLGVEGSVGSKASPDFTGDQQRAG